MAAFAPRRPTRDIDLAASGFANDITEVEQRMRAIVEPDLGDGLLFDPASIAGETIRDDADLTGVRVTATARLATAQVALHIDVNFGDPIWPGSTEAVLPLLLGGSLRLRGYPDHMVLAEKIVTAINFGVQNTRWRDYVDIVAIIQTRRIRYDDLHAAIEMVAKYRQVPVEPLGPLLAAMPDLAQHTWVTWRRKQRLELTTPERFEELLHAYLTFVEPVLDGIFEGRTWDPAAQSWSNEETTP